MYIASVLIGPDGELIGVHRKHVLWDYEYTLFVPSDEELEVYDTELGRIGVLMCADGIVPDVPRVLALKGAQILVNSLNSRGPDELRVHVPLRAMENRVWHVAANTVGGPADAWPWMGGSQIVAPDGTRLATGSEEHPEIVLAVIEPELASAKSAPWTDSVFGFRRPDLYGSLTAPADGLPVAAMFGPAPKDMPSAMTDVATLQVSWFHNTDWTITRAVGQIEYAARRGADLGVLPALFCLPRGYEREAPAAAAEIGVRALARVREAAAANGIWVAVHLVEEDGGRHYSTVFLVNRSGEVVHRYRKTHLGTAELGWATAGDELGVVRTEIGTIGFMVTDEVWVPEVARVLALAGAELICHPADWGSEDEPHVAATERTEENRVHLVSANRLDSAAAVGSQIVRADLFEPGQPIALMRYPTGYWSRHGFEEQLLVQLDLREANSKMMGHHLDPLATREPKLYAVLTEARG